MSRLQEKLDEINRQKLSYIKPENLRQGITAFGVEGAMTSENMWTPIYANNGDYYILSFVNTEGNSNVQNIYGYGGFRIVKFYNDTNIYLFDVRMNKPRQITSDLPKSLATYEILGYTNDFVYVITNNNNYTLNVYKVNISNGEYELVNTTTKNYYRITTNDSGGNHSVENFYIYTCGTDSTFNSYLLHYNIETNKFEELTYMNGYTTGGSGTSWSHKLQIVGNYIALFGGDSDRCMQVYNISTKSKYTCISYETVRTNENYRYMIGLSPDGNYLFTTEGVYTVDLSHSNGLGTRVKNIGISLNKNSYNNILHWVTDKIAVYNDYALLQYDNNTQTFTRIVNTSLIYSKISSTFLEIIVGYSFLGKDYYFNIGNPIITSDKIVAGYYARDQYNQVVKGVLNNNGELNYTPKTSVQTIPSGLTTGGTIAPVTYEIDSDIKPENIRYGVNILGIAGTLEQDAAESVMSQEEYDACINVADDILGTIE